jgi:hypothetical protein
MLSKTDLTRVYETLLSIPGMNEAVKLDLKLPRKHVLLLSKVIERGLAEDGDENEPSILHLATPEIRAELRKVVDDLLQKGGLTEMNEKLKSFG